MSLDIPTLALIQSLMFLTQVVVLGFQFVLDRRSPGLVQWVMGAGLLALGVILMPFVTVKPLMLLALFSNPLYVLGLFFLHVGVVHFLEGKPNRTLLALLYLAFLLPYLGFLFVDNDLGPRTAVLNAVMAAVSFLITRDLFVRAKGDIRGSARFVATIFLVATAIDVVRGLQALTMPPHSDYSVQGAMLRFAFVYPCVLSTLWTFGFVLMLNQRLNAGIVAEKEKLNLVFNTSPDAAFIARWNDGLVVDVNEGFTAMTGYSRDDVIARRGVLERLWHNEEERRGFLAELDAERSFSNCEFSFSRQDGSEFTGLISARIIPISGAPHLVGSIHDISERKLYEGRITELARQLELERNAARRDSVTDSLTGLANRRKFDERLAMEFHRLKRSRTVLSLIMLDIDYFKDFNDTYGHQAGDECLRRVGHLFGALVGRVSDLAVRYGGEEFAFILPETDSEGARTTAERIREAVEGLSIPHAGSGVSSRVTVSLGVASVSDDGASSETLVEFADLALYRAKKAGRNRVEVALPPSPRTNPLLATKA